MNKMMKNIACGLLTSAAIVWTGCGGDHSDTASPQPEGVANETTSPFSENPPPNAVLAPQDAEGWSTAEMRNRVFEAAEPMYWGDFGIRLATAPSNLLESDPHGLPPLLLWLRADDDGELSSLTMNQRSYEPGDWGRLRGTIISLLGDEYGPGSIQESAEVVLYCDHVLRYEHLIDTITAVWGYRDDEDKIVILIQKIGISARGKTPPDPSKSGFKESEEEETDEIDIPRPENVEIETSRDRRDEAEQRPAVPKFPLDVQQGDRVEVPESEVARPPEDPYVEVIGVEVSKSGVIVLHGDGLSMIEMFDRLTRERLILKSMGRSQTDATIVILADKDCPSGRVQDLIKTCHTQGFENFALRVKEASWE
jgi:biopolymer transport protein ExbD